MDTAFPHIAHRDNFDFKSVMQSIITFLVFTQSVQNVFFGQSSMLDYYITGDTTLMVHSV